METQQTQTQTQPQPTAAGPEPTPGLATPEPDTTTVPVERQLVAGAEPKHPLATSLGDDLHRMLSDFFTSPLAERPFSLIRRLSEDLDQLLSSFLGSRFAPAEAFGAARAQWWPQLEVYRSNGKLVILADVPGLEKDDIGVDIRDDELVISGERRTESERAEGGELRSERSYGKFTRAVTLPAGARAESASATFKNGVLRIEIEAPEPESPKPRRIEIREGAAH
jgi:HSP20 family protein